MQFKLKREWVGFVVALTVVLITVLLSIPSYAIS